MKLEYNNIFEVGLEDKPEKAAEMELRADLMQVLSAIVRDKGWSQKTASKKLGISQPYVSLIMNWKVEELTSKRLFACLAHLGFRFKPSYENGDVSCSVDLHESEAALA